MILELYAAYNLLFLHQEEGPWGVSFGNLHISYFIHLLLLNILHLVSMYEIKWDA